jgi:predicted dehydrogenase
LLDRLLPIASAARVTVPAAHRRRIAVIGAGGIVDVAHLPAYRAHSLDVVGLYDVNQATAHDVAARHGIATVYDSVDELLADPAVDVVDIAVPPWVQAQLLPKVATSAKHALCQKPLGTTLDMARELVRTAAAAGIKMAVNQQLRYDEGLATARAMLAAGWIGELVSIRVDVDIDTDFRAWQWLVESPELEYRYHSIHYLDTIRAIAGDPFAVFGRASRRPGQAPLAETRTTSTLLYPGDLHVTLTVNHENPTSEPVAKFVFDGVDGRIHVDLGLLTNYPDGGPDTLRVWSRTLPSDGPLHYPISERWLPHAFIGPMAGLLADIAGEGEAPTSGRNNLGTVALVDALYESSASGQVVALPTLDEAPA